MTSTRPGGLKGESAYGYRLGMGPSYHALIQQTASLSGSGSPLHLIREDAEASLCGLPRPLLSPGGVLDEVMCADCLEWFERRRAVSGNFPKAKPS
jgi:hypothetical protein